jgi:peptidoglycan-N-acetylglucosamine deacetylase
MLNHTNTNRFFFALLILSASLDIFYSFSNYVYVALASGYLAIFIFGVFTIEANFFFESVCSITTPQKICAISFDDGPSHYTLEILEILKQQNIKAAFFCIGKQIEVRENIFQQIHQEGHLIGNHSYCHDYLFDFYSSKTILTDLQRMDSVMKNLIGLKPKLFRPPFGVTNPLLNEAVSQGNYTSVGWSVRSLDTLIKDEDKLLTRVISSLKPGAVFLFHDTQKTTLAILPKFIEHVLTSGYQIVRLDNMLDLSPYR